MNFLAKPQMKTPFFCHNLHSPAENFSEPEPRDIAEYFPVQALGYSSRCWSSLLILYLKAGEKRKKKSLQIILFPFESSYKTLYVPHYARLQKKERAGGKYFQLNLHEGREISAALHSYSQSVSRGYKLYLFYLTEWLFAFKSGLRCKASIADF